MIYFFVEKFFYVCDQTLFIYVCYHRKIPLIVNDELNDKSASIFLKHGLMLNI